MKIKLNESIQSFDAFVSAKTTVATENTAVDASRTSMITDIDSIITSLETLSTQVAEELEAMNDFDNMQITEEELNEEGGLIAWVKGKMLAKKQKKINVMKLKSTDMSTAAAQMQGAEMRDKKAYVMDKKKALDDNIKQIQMMVDDKAKEIGGPAVKIINKTKMEGQMEVIKSQIGNVDPKRAADMKTRLGDIKAKHAEETQAIAQMRDDAEQNAETEEDPTAKYDAKIEDLQAQIKAVDASTVPGKIEKMKLELQLAITRGEKAAFDDNDTTDSTDHDKKAEDLKAKIAKEEEKLANGKVEDEPNPEPTPEPTPEPNPEPTPEPTPKKDPTPEPTPEPTPKKKDDDDDDDDNNSLVIRANAAGLNELAQEIATKLDWQLAEGSTLRLRYESLIKKAESDKTLNESRYVLKGDVMDAFRRLL